MFTLVLMYLKRILLVLCCFFVFEQTNAQAPVDEVSNAIKYGRVGEIIKYFDDVVPVTINNSQSTYSRTQAEMVLKDFFGRNNPTDMAVLSNNSSDNSSRFVVGEMKTSGGIKYSVYILFKLKDKIYVIREIRFNKE